MHVKHPHIPLVIVGGGPIGLACALEAKRRCIPSVVFEKGTLVNSLYHYPVNMTFFSTSERLEIGGVPFVSMHPKPSRPEALEYYRRVAKDHEVHMHLFTEVLHIEREPGDNICYRVRTSRATYTASHIIIATGFYDIPYKLHVPGEDLARVKHYYDDPHFYAFQKVLVVGAQNSAVDAALETWRKGAEVTMIIRGNTIGERVKYWVRPDIINRIEEGSIRAYFHTTIKEIREGEVDIQTPEGILTLENDWVLAMTGYQPNLPFLQKLGIQLCDDETCKPVYNEDTHETNLPQVYLAGVICGGNNTHRLFIENSRAHAVLILDAIEKSRA